MANGNKPSAKFRVGYVTATVWQNGEFFNTTIAKSYKDGSDWKETDSLGHADVVCAIKALERAEQFIAEQQT